MSLDQVISLLVAVTLIEMSFATGLGVRLADVIHAATDGWLLFRSGLANYVAVPAAAVVLLLLVDAEPMVAVGILILAVCPGAPYAPPLTALARGTTATSVGLMVVLAGLSVLLAPLLLSLLLALHDRKSGPACRSARDVCAHRGDSAPPAVLWACRQPLAVRSGRAVAWPCDPRSARSSMRQPWLSFSRPSSHSCWMSSGPAGS